MKKRVLAIVLSLTLIIGVLSAPVMAEEKFSFNFDFLKQLTSNKENNEVPLDSNEIINTQGTNVAEVDFGSPTGVQSYSTVQEAINAAVDGVTTEEGARTVKMIADVEISSELKIDFNTQFVILDLNGYSITGNGLVDSPVINNNGTLTIKDNSDAHSGEISNEAGHYGGGIYNTGKLTINGGSISNNIAKHGGGGIYNCGTLIIDGGNERNVTFSNNSSQNGGAIYNASGSTATIKNAKFSENTANNAGGAIFNNQSTLTLENCEIKKCTAGYYGGAIYNSSTEQSDGSGIIASNTTLKNGMTLSECGIIGDVNHPGNDQMGGAVFNRGILTMEEGAEIKSCYADKGAGVHNHGATYVKFDMNGGKITNNTAQKNGGGVQNSENATFNFNGGEISGNTATTSYGAGIFTKGTLNLNGTVTVNNNNGNNVSSNVAIVKNYPIALGANFSGNVGVSLIEKKDGSYVNSIIGEVTSNGDAADLEHLFADQSEIQNLKYDNGKIELVFSQCEAKTITVALEDVVPGKEYNLYLGDELQTGKYLFQRVGSEWHVQQKVGQSLYYVNLKDDKVVKAQNTATIWNYDGGFYQEKETTKKVLWWTTTKKIKTYLSSTNEGTELSTSKVKVKITYDSSGSEHPYRYTDITNTKHTAICQVCGNSSTADHNYDETTHKCVCGKYHPDHAVVMNNYGCTKLYKTTLISKKEYHVRYYFELHFRLPMDNAVEKVTYSTNGGDTWKTVEDDTITIKSFFKPITSSYSMYIKVKTTDGTTTLYNATSTNLDEKGLTLTRIRDYSGD